MLRLNSWFVLAVFAVFAFMVYGYAVHIPFIIDDRMFLNDNHKNIASLWNSFAVNPNDVYYRPLIHVVFKTMYYYFRDNSFGYHVVNLILYVLCAFSVYALVRQMLNSFLTGFLAGLFFLLHPINHILIVGSSTTCYSLQVIWMILSMYFLSLRLPLAKVWSVACFILAILCHESALILPLYVFGFFYFIRAENWIKSWVSGIGHWLVLGAFLILRMNFARLDHTSINYFAFFKMSMMEYAASFTKLLMWYTGQLILPDGIVPIWAAQVVRQGVGWRLLFLALLMGGLWWLARRMKKTKVGPGLGLWWLMMGFLPLIPACLVEPTRGLVILPYWFVFSSIGFFIFMAQGLNGIVNFRPRDGAVIAGVLTVALVLCWSILSYQYVDLWNNPIRP